MAADKEFVKWLREVINPQADYGNNVCVDDYAKDGNYEYLYPVRFSVDGDSYYWTISKRHTKGRHLCNHYELWFHGPAFRGDDKPVATGELTMTKLRKGFRKIYDYYKPLIPIDKGGNKCQ